MSIQYRTVNKFATFCDANGRGYNGYISLANVKVSMRPVTYSLYRYFRPSGLPLANWRSGG